MNKFDQVVTGALDIAQSEALKRRNTELHAEHLLWGLLQTKSSYAHRSLKEEVSQIEGFLTQLPRAR
jgi:ATP-dependent Clp protease ATP-binding subunit ClpB